MPERYSSLKYPVFQAKEPLDKAFPDLFRLKEFQKLRKKVGWENITTYILILYDRNTELIQEYPSDLNARKEAAATDAGWQKRADKWSKEVQDIFNMQNEDVYHAIMAFLKLQNYVVWTEVVVTEQELFEFQKLRMMSIDTGKRKKSKDEDGKMFGSDNSDKDIFEAAKKKDALLNACDTRIKYLEGLYRQFYGDSKDDLMGAEFKETMTPEIAERLFNEIEPPYEIIKT